MSGDSDRIINTVFGPRPAFTLANIVRRVVENAVGPGHSDKRHKDHWHEWKDWPVADGRQWDGGQETGRYELDKEWVREHERRQQPQHQGPCNSLLRVERKLEGCMWDKDKPRTTMRSIGLFANDMIEQHGEDIKDEDEVDSDSDGEDISEIGGQKGWFPVLAVAGTESSLPSAGRHTWNSAVAKDNNCRKSFDLNGEIQEQFLAENPLEPFFRRFQPGMGDVNEEDEPCVLTLSAMIYRCTDAFATPDEQKNIHNDESEEGTLSISVSCVVHYVDVQTGKLKLVGVVAESQIPGPTGKAAHDVLHDRVAGFVFFSDYEKFAPNLLMAPNGHDNRDSDGFCVVYTESCEADWEALNYKQMDSLLEYQALIVNRLVDNCVKDSFKGTLPLTVPKVLRGNAKYDMRGLPPVRTLKCYSTIHRSDPRFPLRPPNSGCLECGKSPNHPDATMRCDAKPNKCSKCRARVFCSQQCLKASWKSKIWPHKYECSEAAEQDRYSVGTSLRENTRAVAAELGTDAAQAVRIVESVMGADELDAKANSIDELHAQRKAKRKSNRKKGRKKK